MRRLCLAAVFAFVGAAPALAQDDATFLPLTASFGVDYSNGDYGTASNTNVLVGLTSLSTQVGDFRVNLSAPYLQLSGQGLVVFDAQGNPIVIDQSKGTPSNTRSGFGDISLSSTYALPSAILDDFELNFTGRVKIPVASQRLGLSTGAPDFGFSLDVSKEFGSWGPFVTIGYLFQGQPAYYSLDDTVSLSAGTSVELTDNLIAIVSYDYDSASTPLIDASQDMFGSLSWVFNETTTLTGYGIVGLSSGSPNIGGGLLLSYKLR